MLKKYPNFFIIGAPKTGTTSIYNFLINHPNVYMSRPKGPHYFSKDIVTSEQIRSKDDYQNLFKKAKKKHITIGEASVLYLFSKNAIENISKELPESKIIVVLRNPVEVIQSWHAELVWGRLEKNEDIEIAWDKNIELQKNGTLKDHRLEYHNIARYGLQIDVLFKYFPKNQVKIIYYEEYSKSTKRTYNSLLKFLNIPEYYREQFEHKNQFKRYRIKWLQNILVNPPSFIITTKKLLKINRFGMYKILLRMNTFSPNKPTLSNEFKKKIIKNYYHDTIKLSKILNKNFIDSWY
jgi:hypothetical protein